MSPLKEDVLKEEFGTDAHIYRPPLFLRVGIVLGPALLFFIVVSMQSGQIRANFSAESFLLLLVVVSWFAYAALKTLTYRVLLSDDAITVVSLFGRRRFERAEIAWRWSVRGTPLMSPPLLVIVPKDRAPNGSRFDYRSRPMRPLTDGLQRYRLWLSGTSSGAPTSEPVATGQERHSVM